MAHHDESLIDKFKHALGMDHEHEDSADTDHVSAAATATDEPIATEADDDRAEGRAGVPQALHDDSSATQASDDLRTDDDTDEPSGLGRNPGPVGSARYEDAAAPDELGGTDSDPYGGVDSTREDAAATEYGGAYGEDDTPMPTKAAWDRGEAQPDEPESGSDEDLQRRETGI